MSKILNLVQLAADNASRWIVDRIGQRYFVILLSLLVGVASGIAAVTNFLRSYGGAVTLIVVLIDFGRTDNLKLSNLRTSNANGFAMIAFDVHDLTAERVVFRPSACRRWDAGRPL